MQVNGFPQYFDWNCEIHPSLPNFVAVPKPTLAQLELLEFDDEGPRDGVQGTSVFPGARDVERYAKLVSQVGIRVITVGIFSGVGSRAEKVTFSVLKYLARQLPQMIPVVIVRPCQSDLDYAVECAKCNPNLEVLIFQGSSSPRMWVQGWTEEQVLSGIAIAIDFVNHKIGPHALATLEDATRATPEFIENFLRMAVEHQAARVVFADTTGHLDMWGAFRFISFSRSFLDSLGEAGRKTEIDFHGHRDRGLDIPVALAAISAGVTRLHGVVLGVGERAGNTTLEALLYNVARMTVEAGGTSRYDLSKLPTLCRQYARMTGVTIPDHYPLVGKNAFLTAVGIHADAQEKGLLRLQELAQVKVGVSEVELESRRKILRTIYTSVDHQELGRVQRYVIGPLCGDATVRMWLYSQGYPVALKQTSRLVSAIKNFAKLQNHMLRDEEIIEFLAEQGIKRMQQVLPSQSDRLG